MIRARVAVDTPAHAGLGDLLDYESEQPLAAGTMVRVPLGRRDVPGIVWDATFDGRAAGPKSPAGGDDFVVKSVGEVLASLPPLPPAWRRLVEFSARYYQRSLGELALAVLPPELRKLDDAGLAKRLRLQDRRASAQPAQRAAPAVERPALTTEQAAVLAALDGAAPACHLLHGVTGSGKTEVYLRLAEIALAAGRQALVLVPEINLTPQLEARFAARFPGRRLVSLHSGLTPAQRLANWLAAHRGQADLVLGTRLAIFCPLPRLGLIVVDEEHDPSYKQQDGARYSARDLAVYRGHLEGVPVLLGSATPSLESWQHAQTGRYRLLTMTERVGHGVLPTVRVLDMAQQPRPAPGEPPLALAPALKAAIEERIARGEQSLLFLNRRGFAPVLNCTACGWKSGCPHCSAWRVFHKSDRTLRCHHCAFTERVPRACPDCGNLDIQPMGRGTEKLEEQMGQLLQGVARPEGGPARVARIDADTTRLKGTLEQQLAAMHAGEVDVLVGTQMVTKGHDFRRVTLVAAVDPDGALFTADFRAPERLFATLMQAAGRAGRDAEVAAASEMWVQTANPGHALFAALRTHDYARFAASQLREREMAGLPPFAHLALLRAEAREASVAEGFLKAAREAARSVAESLGLLDALNLYAPVPPHVARVAGHERRQMLVESSSRAALQRVLSAWVTGLPSLRAQHKGIVRWAIDVDPVAI
ncbi:MAG TPA: primosomal protein N' [Ideonella sp.]|nr:primosomal protein N' [Ideonella sp.]